MFPSLGKVKERVSKCICLHLLNYLTRARDASTRRAVWQDTVSYKH
jgi:hypothetical protein